MGRLSDRLFHGGGPRPRSNGSDTGPLRKIIGTTWVESTRMEALECGHLQMPKRDLIGETNAVRRRCKFCKSGRPALFSGNPPVSLTLAEYDKQYEKPKDSGQEE